MLQRTSVTTIAKGTAHSMLTWEWTRRLLHWLIISAGTASELAFLIASVWMSVNASVHSLVLLLMPETTAEYISYLATAAYVALPELILGLAVVTTISHVRLWLYNKKDYSALIWSVLYGVPTLLFIALSLVTLANSVLSIDFRLPASLIVARALSGFGYAFTSLLYTQLGGPQEKDRLQQKDTLLAALRQEKDAFIESLRQEKDAMIAALRVDNTRLMEVTHQQKEELQTQKELLETSKEQQSLLLKALNKSDEDALQAYSDECMNWLKSGVKTVLMDEITRHTGHSKRKVMNAITSGQLQTAPRNKDLILVSSLAQWLRNTPPPVAKDEHQSDSITLESERNTDSLKVLIPGDFHQEPARQNGHNHN